MTCSPFELKDYFFGELPAAERFAVENHVAACPACREELAALSGTRAALLSVVDEEPPRRIAFVSDKVFEPRWWQRIWHSGPQLGFGAAAMLAGAIVVHGVAARPVATAPAPTPVAQVSQVEIDRRVHAEVARVLAEEQTKQLGRVLDVVNAKLKHTDERYGETLVLIRESLERMEKRNARMTRQVLYE